MNNNFVISTNGEVLCKCLTDAEGSITIPEGIVAIRQDAFRGCKKITNVIFPATIKKIGSNAFRGCISLKGIQLPSGVEYIGSGAFFGCHFMKSAVIPSSIVKLHNSTFEGCLRLKKVKMPESGLRVIADDCFKKCLSLEKIVIPASVVNMGRAFVDCWKLKKVIIKNKNISVKKSAFLRCDEELTLNGTVTARYFLYNCNNNMNNVIKQRSFSDRFLFPHTLKLRLPDSIELIEEEAFCGCTGLEHLVISHSVKNIEPRAFSGCENLTQLIIEEGLEVVGGYAFENCMSLKNLHLPDSLKIIKEFAFTGCTSLTGVSVSLHTQVAETAFDDNVRITYRQ